jgi:hypothetical protein
MRLEELSEATIKGVEEGWEDWGSAVGDATWRGAFEMS